VSVGRSRDDVVASVRRALNEHPGLTMDALAVAAGVSRASLYTMFGRRDALVGAAGIPAPPPLRERVLRAGAEVLAEGGLAGLSVDEAALRAGVSRAGAFRLFPGKGALFQELLRTYVPMRETVELVRAMSSARPEVVMAEVARSLLRTEPAGVAVLRAVLFELRGNQTDFAAAVDDSLVAYGVLAAYLEDQMTAGNLTPMHPYLAIQLFVGPILAHLFNQEVVAERVGFTLTAEEAATTFTQAWLRAMRPPRTRRRPARQA
jgi:AcrR family transcriptional regulator